MVSSLNKIDSFEKTCATSFSHQFLLCAGEVSGKRWAVKGQPSDDKLLALIYQNGCSLN